MDTFWANVFSFSIPFSHSSQQSPGRFHANFCLGPISKVLLPRPAWNLLNHSDEATNCPQSSAKIPPCPSEALEQTNGPRRFSSTTPCVRLGSVQGRNANQSADQCVPWPEKCKDAAIARFHHHTEASKCGFWKWH